MFFGGSPATFSVGTSFLVCVSSFTFEFGGPLARLLQFSTCCFMSCWAVANLPEGAVQFLARIVMGFAQGECSKQTKMKHGECEDETETCLSCGMSVIDS